MRPTFVTDLFSRRRVVALVAMGTALTSTVGGARAAPTAVGAATVAPKGSPAAPTSTEQRRPNVKADFNDDGYDDLVTSVFGYDDNGVEDAGAISVIYGSPTGLNALAGPGNQLWTQDSPGVPDQSEFQDLWGRSLGVGDYDGDGFTDLAIGAPHEDIEGFGKDQGQVTVLYGSAGGLTSGGAQLWNQDSAGILDKVEPGDLFARSLYGADFNGDGFDDLAIGAAYEDVSNQFDAGAVNVFYGSAAGLASPGNQFWSQDSPGILDQSEPIERLGWSVAGGDYNADGFDDLAIGVPGEELSGLDLAGGVNVVIGSSAGLTSAGNQFWNQDSPDIIDQVEAGDLFGRNVRPGDFNDDGFDDLVIGVPSEGVGPTEIPDSGSCAVIYGSAAGLGALAGPGNQLWSQDSPGIKDQAEAHDHFCRHMGIGDFNRDGYQDLSIGVVSEDLGFINDTGSVNVIYGTADGLTAGGNQIWGQDSPGILGEAEFLDAFGRAATGFDFNGDGFSDLTVGAPGDHVAGLLAAGSVNVIYGAAPQLTSAGNQLWNMESPDILGDPQSGALFGAGLADQPAGGCGAGGTCAE
jgi:FG-GAP repeat